jgi:hypothetical protein
VSASWNVHCQFTAVTVVHLVVSSYILSNEIRHAYKVLVGKPEGKRPLGIPRRILEDNVKTDLKRNKLLDMNGLIWFRIGYNGGDL